MQVSRYCGLTRQTPECHVELAGDICSTMCMGPFPQVLIFQYSNARPIFSFVFSNAAIKIPSLANFLVSSECRRVTQRLSIALSLFCTSRDGSASIIAKVGTARSTGHGDSDSRFLLEE